MEEYRIYCIFSQEAIDGMANERGKIAAQAGHAYLHACWDADNRFPENVHKYKAGLARKITLVIPTTEEMVALYEAHKFDYPSTLVEDSGFTVFNGPTLTCVGIGPVPHMTFENTKLLK